MKNGFWEVGGPFLAHYCLFLAFSMDDQTFCGLFKYFSHFKQVFCRNGLPRMAVGLGSHYQVPSRAGIISWSVEGGRVREVVTLPFDLLTFSCFDVWTLDLFTFELFTFSPFELFTFLALYL